jgi:hypothetical protein
METKQNTKDWEGDIKSYCPKGKVFLIGKMEKITEKIVETVVRHCECI